MFSLLLYQDNTMDAAKRNKNEREFDHWIDLPDNSRKYWFDVIGKTGGYARCIKRVDDLEITISFVQEIYNSEGILVQIHEKYPVDKGHIILTK